MTKNKKNTGASAPVKKQADRIGRSLYVMYLLFLALALFLVFRLICLQFGNSQDPKITKALTPTSRTEAIEPFRGAILSDDGRILAMSLPVYDIHMDCTVRKAEFEKIRTRNTQKADSLENIWNDKAWGLAEGLSRILGDRSSDDWFKAIREGRANNQKYLLIANGVERKEYNEIVKLPLFNEGKNKGGFITNERVIRKYPYGTLARRAIGFIRSNSAVGNTYVGIEGKFDHALHGKDGKISLRKIDGGLKVQDSDSAYVKAVDGQNIRTTLNIDIQDIVDAALREQIGNDSTIAGGCAVLMEVQTGAIKAMVNLWRDKMGSPLEESTNLAIGRLGEPGSIFKTTLLTTLLEDKKIKSLDETIPTNHGHINGFNDDDHIRDYEYTHKVKEIPIIDGFKMSSNYVFRYLANKYYGTHPKDVMDRLYMYKLGESFDFDLEGMATPVVPDPNRSDWSGTSLGSVAIGYSVMETPLHILTFYNGIANKGKLMKPYLVESIEEHGIVKEKRQPSVLNASICSKATADTLLRALKAVTEDGTATRLKGAKCSVAGKTGTARMALSPAEKNGSDAYIDKQGRFKNQGTFVGFFPADDPKYSIIITIYSFLSHKSAYGGTRPAAAVRTIVDEITAIEPRWDSVYTRTSQIPVMKAASIAAAEAGTVPDVKGAGLSDALYILENAGYNCTWSGIGKVATQSPKEGTKASKGTTIKLTLK